MSKYVTELITDIKNSPNSWTRYRNDGIQKGNIQIFNLGGKPIFSVIMVWINGKDTPTTYIDCWRLEVAVRNWFKTVSLDKLSEL